METKQKNPCIACMVSECVHHCDTQDYCSLDKILVGAHESAPTTDQCTDCMSFAKK